MIYFVLKEKNLYVYGAVDPKPHHILEEKNSFACQNEWPINFRMSEVTKKQEKSISTVILIKRLLKRLSDLIATIYGAHLKFYTICLYKVNIYFLF